MRSRWLIGAVASMALLGAGCANGGSASEPSGGSPATTQASGGSYSVGVTEPDHLHPGRAQLAFDELHVLFSPLLTLDKDRNVLPLAAESVTSDDQQTWTIKLKPGWTFHNGDPVTAASYVDAWNAVAYAPNALENNGQLARVEGYGALNPAKGKPTAKTLSGLKVVDDATFMVKLIAPDSQFPLSLTGGVTAFLPLPKQALDDPKAFDSAPIGNGPYMMDGTWKKNESITVKRFAGYKGEPGKADEIVFKSYADLKTSYRDVQAGGLDLTFVGQDQYEAAVRDFGDRLLKESTPQLDFLIFSPTDKRFDDPEVRKAFSQAIDREAINKALYGGLQPPATSILSPAYQGAEENVCDYCTFDATKAKARLQAAGGFSGTLQITYPGGVGYDPTFEAIGNQLRKNLGISDIKFQPLPFAQFLEKINGHQVKGLIRGHWGSLYPSMQEPLQSLFVPGGAGQVAGDYSNPAVTKLVDEGNAAPDEAGAVANYRAAEDQILADAGVAPTWYPILVYAHSPKIANVGLDTNVIDYASITVTGQ
jgi:oligopeptide transport system substrate-binding protein